MRAVFCLLSLGLLLPGVGGCTSIYRRTSQELPSGPAAELRVEIAHAEEAERLVQQAGKRLLSDLQAAKPSEVTEADCDRLEAATFELERRVLSARDGAKGSQPSSELIAKLEQLGQRTERWLAYVRIQRTAEMAARTRQLQELLR